MEQNIHQDEQFAKTDTLLPFLKRIFGHAKKSYPKYFWGLVVTVLIVALTDASFIKIWGDYIDALVVPEIALSQSENYTFSFQKFMPFVWIYITWMLIMAVGVMGFVWCAEQIKERVVYDLREQMFTKLQRLSFSYYDKSAIGWLVSRITSDADRVVELISWGFVMVVWGLGMVAGSFAFMFSINYKLGFIVLSVFPVLLFIAVKIRILVLKYARQARKQNSELIAYFIEHINGVVVNKSMVQEDKATDNFKEVSYKMKQYSYKSAFYTAMYVPVVIMSGSIAAAMVIFFGGLDVLYTGLTIGVLSSFFGYARNIFEPIFDISRFYAMAQDSLSAGERIFSLIDEKIDIQDAKDTLDFKAIKGDIEFQNVDFYYDKEKSILKSFDLKIEAGQSIALVGPTGHGKTTLTALINRFYEPKSGQLLIDGIDYQERTLHSLRSQMGVILQSPHLFSGTVRENILFGVRGTQESEQTNEQIKSLLTQIGADSLIAKLDMEVGEEGNNLSNGERQLVSFARAVVKNPAILILDEATSSIDTMTEAKIQESIREIIKDRTSIIIAHRLSTIKNCDKIVVIENGAVKEQGNHDELIKAKGHYHNLYMKQRREIGTKS
ncbi:MAG: ABC transporter ATP-binding protein [Chitinophagales bacterium]